MLDSRRLTSLAMVAIFVGMAGVAATYPPEARLRLSTAPNVELRRGELEKLPLDDDSLDAATLILVLHHLSDPARALKEVARVLRPGGRLLLVDMLPHDRQEYRTEMGHIWLGFDPERVRQLTRDAGLVPGHVHPLPVDAEAEGPALFAAVVSRPPIESVQSVPNHNSGGRIDEHHGQ